MLEVGASGGPRKGSRNPSHNKPGNNVSSNNNHATSTGPSQSQSLASSGAQHNFMKGAAAGGNFNSHQAAHRQLHQA